MPKHLTRMAIDKVSLVDAGANERRIAILKSANRQPLDADESPGLLRRVADALGLAVPEAKEDEEVEKAETFDDINAERELSAAVDEGFDTLRSAVWGATYARDDDGNELPMDEKAALVGRSIDQFKAYLMDAMTVAKVGRKISGSRLEQIKSAFRVLGEVIEGVEAGWWTPPEGTVAKEVDMTPDEIQAAVDKAVAETVAKAMAPDSEAMTALAAGISKSVIEAMPKPVEATLDTTYSDDGDLSLADIAKAVSTLADRVNVLGGSSRQSAAGSESEPVEKSKYPLAGIL